jgi:hypothetical protein
MALYEMERVELYKIVAESEQDAHDILTQCDNSSAYRVTVRLVSMQEKEKGVSV